MKKQQSGFTLIELVMVIVILGILAATALPKFIDLSAEANQAAVDGVAAAAGSAFAINYAVRSANSGKGTAVNTCDDASSIMTDFPASGYTVASTSLGSSDGDTIPCAITGGGSTSANFTGIYKS